MIDFDLILHVRSIFIHIIFFDKYQTAVKLEFISIVTEGVE